MICLIALNRFLLNDLYAAFKPYDEGSQQKQSNWHCVKSSVRIQSECRKIQIKKTTNAGTFYAV